MPSLDDLQRGVALMPPRILVYGPHGVGKTTLACGAPSPILIQTEGGKGILDVPSWGPLRTYAEIVEAIGVLANEEHDFQTVILDTLDWCEPLVWSETCRVNGWENIESAGYGKGYVATADAWRYLLDGFETLRIERGMTVIFTAHCDVKQYKAPECEPYDRYMVKLHSRASAIVQEHVDAVLFLAYQTAIKKDKVPGNRDGRARGVGAGQRMIHTEERPPYLAKNRWSMPEQISIPNDATQAWAAVAAYLPFFNQIVEESP